ncbi:putative pseudouridine transporter, partial [Haemophilus influenzae]
EINVPTNRTIHR